MDNSKRAWMIWQVGTRKCDGWYFQWETACESKALFDQSYPNNSHRIMEAGVDMPWFPLSAAEPLRSP